MTAQSPESSSDYKRAEQVSEVSMKRLFGILIAGLAFTVSLWAQEEVKEESPAQILSQSGYEKSAAAVVKLVSDAGRNIGAGVIVGIHNDGIGFILTSYSLVAGRDKVAVIVKDYPDALLGHVLERWVDFELDLAVVAVRNFPPEQMVVTLGGTKSVAREKQYTVIGHTEFGDWLPIPVTVRDMNDHYFGISAGDYVGLDGSPLVTEDGKMIGLVVSDEKNPFGDDTLLTAVRIDAVQPILEGWFQPIALRRKWRQKGTGLAKWIWAVGGGVLGGTIAAALAVGGGGGGTPRGLPRPPAPPNNRP